MMVAMAAIMGGNSMPSYSAPRRKSNPTPRNLSPEEQEAYTKKLMDNFATDIVIHNSNMRERFKGWKTYQVNGIDIVSSNIKNARKTFVRIMKENLLTEGNF